MARMSIDIPTTLNKIEPKTGTLRRTSTGNSSTQIIEPNYLRVSTGSCRDFCQYDIKRAFPVKPWCPVGRILDKNVNVSLDNNHRGTKALTSPKVMSVSTRQLRSELSKPKTSKTDAFSRILEKNVYVSLDNDHRGKKALTSPKVISVSSRKQHIQLLKPKTSKTDTLSHQPAQKQPIRTLLTSSSDKRESQNDAGKEVKTPKKSNSPRISYPKLPTAKSRTGDILWKKDSQPEIKNRVEKNKTCSSRNVPEKIIHVIEPEDEYRNKSLLQESRNCTGFTTLSSNQSQRLNSAAENNRKKAIEGARVIILEENYLTPKKMKFKRGKVPVIENGNAVDRSFRRPVSEGKVNHKKNDSIGGVPRHQAVEWKNGESVLLNTVIEERASNLVKMRKTKVEALVGAFESVISKTQDS